MRLTKAVEMAHSLLATRLAAARTAVDATAGNGHDTLFLARNTPADAAVWAFDVQPAALAATARRLAAAGLTGKCRLVQACHARVDEHLAGPIDAAMFNLGYLPGGSHELTTTAATTVAALRKFIGLLAAGGLISVVAYPGHPAGREENLAVAAFLAGLPQTAFTAACWRMLNQKNEPPVLYIVEKIGREPA